MDMSAESDGIAALNVARNEPRSLRPCLTASVFEFVLRIRASPASVALVAAKPHGPLEA